MDAGGGSDLFGSGGLRGKAYDAQAGVDSL